MALPVASTVLTGTAPYFKGTTTRVWSVPTIANPATPTLAELSAGKDITAQITAIAGFVMSQASLPLNLAGAGYTGEVGGRTSTSGSMITFELSSTGPTGDIRTTLTPQLLTNIVFFNEGVVTAGACDIWAVRVGDFSPPQDLEVIAEIQVPMFSYKRPSLNVTIPTA